MWWAEVDAPGKLGRAAWPGSGIGVADDLAHLRDHHRASIVLAVADDATEVVDAARELSLDVRQLVPGSPAGRVRQQGTALAADLRAGRRVVVVGPDPSAAALPACFALVLLGKNPAESERALGGSALAARERDALAELLAEREGAVAERSASEGTGGVAGSADDGAQARETSLVVTSAGSVRAAEPMSAEPSSGEAIAAADASEVAPALHADRDGQNEKSGASVAAPAHGRSGAPASSGGGAALAGGEAGRAPASEVDATLRGDTEGQRAAVGEKPEKPSAGAKPRAKTGATGADLTSGSKPAGDTDPASIARSPRLSRLAGAVLGAAIGDAMGHPTEFIRSFEAIREEFGPDGVQGYEKWIDEAGRRVAPYTDDTQMAEQVLRSLFWSRERDADLDATMRELAARFVSWADEPQGGHRAPGNACLAGCRNLKRGVPWYEAGGPTAGGCGSVMRAYPFGLVFAGDLARAERWAVAHSKLTHRDPIALAASAAMAVGVARVLRDDPLEVVLSEMVAAACRYSPKTAGMMARALDEAQSGVPPETTLARLEGWAAHEAIAAAVYLFARHPDDPRAAILEGANTPGDSDSLATLAGALVGARCGIGALPADWVRDVERSAELLALASAV